MTPQFCCLIAGSHCDEGNRSEVNDKVEFVNNHHASPSDRTILFGDRVQDVCKLEQDDAFGRRKVVEAIE